MRIWGLGRPKSAISYRYFYFTQFASQSSLEPCFFCDSQWRKTVSYQQATTTALATSPLDSKRFSSSSHCLDAWIRSFGEKSSHIQVQSFSSKQTTTTEVDVHSTPQETITSSDWESPQAVISAETYTRDAAPARDLEEHVNHENGALNLNALLNNLSRIVSTELSKNPLTEDANFCRKTADMFHTFLKISCEGTVEELLLHDLTKTRELLSTENVSAAFWVLSEASYKTDVLSGMTREWEKYLGKLKLTALTDQLSYRLLIANGKAGNVGRVLSLLQLRRARSYPARIDEFHHAILSLKISSLSQHQNGKRNIFLSDSQQPAIDNPTRWLDAILLNMSQRGFALTTPMANMMIECYSATGGRTGKATHHFYRVVGRGVLNIPPEERPKDVNGLPHDWIYVPTERRKIYQPIKVKVEFHKKSPPFYKVPSLVRGTRFYDRNEETGELKFERELEPNYSFPLTAAFAFTDSLQHGACGHKAIQLDVNSYNALIKACVLRGALWRAMHVLDTSMPSAKIAPNTQSYNYLLSGLASVGDVEMAQEYYLKMYNSGLKPNSDTVRVIVDGLLNMNDIPRAVTVVQDLFNQHSVLPHLWTHYKILELSLGQEMVFEAKRYLFFIQQLWKWKQNKYHDEEFVQMMRETQATPGLQKQALKKLFAYFGEQLKDTDFLP